MPLNLGKITNGVDFNYFKRIVVTSTEFGSASDDYAADAFLNIKGGIKVLTLVNEGANTIEYSFNGNTIHGDLIPNTPTAALSFDNRTVSKIWFRVTAAGPSTIRVEAW
jgi:hypothetical protein